MKAFRSVEGVSESIDHKTFRPKDLKAIAECLLKETGKLPTADRELSFMILFHDNSVKMQDDPQIFEDINKPVKSVWMHLKIPIRFAEIRVEINESSQEQSNSFIAISHSNLDWVFAMQGKLREIIKGLDNKTEQIYQLPGWTRFLLVLFNLALVILFSYSFLLLFNSFFRLPEVYSIVLFVVVVQLLLGIIPFLTSNRFQTVLKELRPRIEFVTDMSRLERESKSTRWAIVKYFAMPFAIGLLTALFSLKFLQ